MEYKTWAPPAGWAQLSKFAEELKFSCIMQREKYKGPKTEIWDSLTNLTALLVEESKELQRGNIIVNPADETIFGNKKVTPDKPDYGKYSLRVSGPADYKYEAEGMREFMSLLKGLNSGIFHVKINQIFTAHIIPLWGKPEKDGKEQAYAENVIVGSRIFLRDKILASIGTVFDEVYEFKKDSKNRHLVQFNGELARSVLIPNDVKVYDITDLNFYDFWQKKIASAYPQYKKEKEEKGAINGTEDLRNITSL